MELLLFKLGENVSFSRSWKRESQFAFNCFNVTLRAQYICRWLVFTPVGFTLEKNWQHLPLPKYGSADW